MIVLCTSQVFAFAVSSTYHKGKPLELQPGESAEIDIKLQNMVGEGGDIVAEVELVEGNDIAQLSEDLVEVTVPFNTFTTRVPVQVTIPENAEIGTVKNIALSVAQKSESSGALLTLTTSYRVSIPVHIGEVSNSPPIVEQPEVSVDVNSIVTVVSVLLLLVLFLLMMMYDKRRK